MYACEYKCGVASVKAPYGSNQENRNFEGYMCQLSKNNAS